MISFIIFSGSNINESFNNIVGLFNFSNPFINKFTIHYLKDYGLVLIIAIFLSTPILKNTIIKLKENKKINNIINILDIIVLLILLVIVTSYLIDSSYNPFLYFRF